MPLTLIMLSPMHAVPHGRRPTGFMGSEPVTSRTAHYVAGTSATRRSWYRNETLTSLQIRAARADVPPPFLPLQESLATAAAARTVGRCADTPARLWHPVFSVRGHAGFLS